VLEASWVVKRGEAGVIVDGTEYAALAVDVVDTTGAGDAFAAGFLVGGVALGLEAAARCCSQLGAMP
jgi:sugar/nucleoside kinase (ribokinase family)